MKPRIIFLDGIIKKDLVDLGKEINSKTSSIHLIYYESVLIKMIDELRRFNFSETKYGHFMDFFKREDVLIFHICYDEYLLQKKYRNHLYIFEKMVLLQQLYNDAIEYSKLKVTNINIYHRFNAMSIYDSFIQEKLEV